jgi:hypothetical protein
MNKALLAAYTMGEVEKAVNKIGGTIIRINTDIADLSGLVATVSIRFSSEQALYDELLKTVGRNLLNPEQS